MIANDLHDVNPQMLIHDVFKRCNQRDSRTWYIYVLADTRIMLQESKHIFDPHRSIPKTRIRILRSVTSLVRHLLHHAKESKRIPDSL